MVVATKGKQGGTRPGAGRKRQLAEPTTVKLDRSTHDEIVDLGEQTGQTADGVIRMLLALYRQSSGR